MDELLPCPFCGGTAIRIERLETCNYSAVCRASSCWTDGPWALTAADAVAKWNTRSALSLVANLGKAQPFIGDDCPRLGDDDGPDALEDV